MGLTDKYLDIPFTKQRDILANRDEMTYNPDLTDHSVNYFLNALFWPVNMVDYEDELIGGQWTHFKLPNQDEAAIANHDQEGYTSGYDMTQP